VWPRFDAILQQFHRTAALLRVCAGKSGVFSSI
jgi:hypothetical protein